MWSFLLKEHIVAGPGFNRWKVPPASIAIHLCIGSVYAWSVFNEPLTRLLGVRAPAAGDWRLMQVTWIFSIAIVFLGLSAAVAGKWLERVGPRMVGCVAACCWGGGFILGSVGIVTHQLWLLYLGYGVIGGCGLGLGYVSPVSTLIRWFPDRRGMATGMAIMGFGGGAIIGTPLKEWLLRLYAQPAVDLGPLATLQMMTDERGVRLARAAGAWQEVVVANAGSGPDAVAHAYVVGSGSTGIAATFLTLGLGYFLVMLIAAFCYRVPAPGWKPQGWNPPAADARSMITAGHVHIDQALKTPQFYLLWIVLCFNVTAGIGVLSVAKTMMKEIFSPALPTLVTNEFTALYVTMISVFNMAGRFGWASLSDHIGRKNAYHLFFGLGIVLYLAIPLCAYQVGVSGATLWLVLFYGITLLIFTMYGGGFATIPAYLADIFGTRYVGGIHGRLLTAWSTAGVLGPLAITQLRERSMTRALHELAATIDPAAFAATFGAPIAQLDTLIASKTVTIANLMAIAPAGAVNPSSTLYNTTMFLMAGLLAVALVANAMIRPVSDHHLMADEPSREANATRTTNAEPALAK
jgi:MFS family permease